MNTTPKRGPSRQPGGPPSSGPPSSGPPSSGRHGSGQPGSGPPGAGPPGSGPPASVPSGKPPGLPAHTLYGIIGLLVAVLLIGTGAVLWFGGSAPGGIASIGGPFTLVNGDGKPVSDRDFRGKYMLVYFGYTFCPDVCPTTLNAVADALDRLGPKADKLRTVFITVDPRRDTPPVVKQYAAAFGTHVEGLTGSPEEIAKVAKEYRVYYAEHRTGPGPDDYSMDHSSILYLMGPDGTFIAPVRADQTGEEMARILSKWLG